MTNQELYINGVRVNLGVNFGVRLNRQLLNPAELNTKDAQFSFSITLPAGGVNDAAFNFSSIEETRDKFNRLYAAEYIVNGIRIFKGNFKLTSVTASTYKGNLYVPAPKTVKDIFGEIKLNQNPELRIPFTDFAASLNGYNVAAATTAQYAIFPYVLYGLIPKVPLNRDLGTYSARTLWDSTARLGITDLAPAINPMKLLKHIFTAQGYTLAGTAFQDKRLTNLYMSYKNASDYIQPWNYGQYARMHISGRWSNWQNTRAANAAQFEKGAAAGDASYITDLFDAVNTSVVIQEDTGGNILYREIPDSAGKVWVNCQMRIPMAGFYKIEFNASIHVATDSDFPVKDTDTDIVYISGQSPLRRADMTAAAFELRVVRDNGKGDFNTLSALVDGRFYLNNQPQNNVFDTVNVPKYFPQVGDNGQVNFIDRKQDPNALLGFMFGKGDGLENPRDDGQKLAQVYAAKPALSWDNSESGLPLTRLAIKSSGWWKYGEIGIFDTGAEDPNLNIDYSGGTRITGKVLDSNGIPQTPAGGNIANRISGYYLSNITGFQTPAADYEVTDFISLAEYTALTFDGEVVNVADMAVVCFYDSLYQFIGFTPYVDDTYSAEPILPPAGAAYVRLTGYADPAPSLVVAGGSATSINVILSRFQLQRYYTYTLTAPVGANYTGYAYLFNGAATYPAYIAPFIDGVATFDTAFTPAITFDPRLTIYLRTPDFSVDGTLIISREITNSSATVIGWELSNKYKIDLNNAPLTYAKRGKYGNADADVDNNGQGSANAVVWLEAGELITIQAATTSGKWRNVLIPHDTNGYPRHNVLYDLKVTPFRTDAAWLKVNAVGDGTGVMDWNDAPTFDTDTINLVGFLNADMKTDDWVENFCKTFNLRLSQTAANTYALDVKQSRTSVSSQYVNLDNIASIKDRENTPLGLPTFYKLGFTIDTEEQGYIESGDDGGGTYDTGAIDGGTVEQKSTFSYNWFKSITKVEAGGNITLALPIISKAEVWTNTLPYAEAMAKRYTDQPYRFWYYDGLLNSTGATFAFNGASLSVARVSNQIPSSSVLNYKNAPYTILDNYFTILINASSHYTELEGTLTPRMYAQLDGSIMAMFNGDLYFIAELGGYDPTGKNKTTIKLIRKI